MHNNRLKISIEFDFDFTDDPDVLRKAFHENGGFQDLSERETGTISIKLHFKDQATKEKVHTQLLEHDNAQMEGLALYGFGQANSYDCAAEYTGTFDEGLSFASDLTAISGRKWPIIDITAKSQDDHITHRKLPENLDDQEIWNRFQQWVFTRLNNNIRRNTP